MKNHWTRAQLGWLLYDPANSGYALIVRTVFAPMFFLYCTAGLLPEARATSLWGYAVSAAGIIAGLVSLRAGSWADVHSKKKLLLAVTAGIGVLSVLITPLFRPGPDWKVLLPVLGIGLLCYMAANSFYDALLTNVAPRKFRDTLSSMACAAGYLGGMIPFLLCMGLSLLPIGPAWVMRLSFPIAALWWVLLSLPMLKLVRERPPQPRKSVGILATLRKVASDRNVLIFLIAYFLYIDGVGTIYLMATPLAVGMGITSRWLLITILGLQLFAFPCTLLYGKCAEKFSPRTMLYFGIGVYFVISLLVGAMPFLSLFTRRVLFVILATMIGVAQGGLQALSRSVFSRLIPPEDSASYFAVYNFFGKFTTIVGPVLIGIAVHCTGRSEYGVALLSLPFLLGALLLSRVRLDARHPAKEQ